jgi:hypothetical protein
MGLIVLEPVPGTLAPDNSSYSVVFRKVSTSTHAANQAHLPINLLPNLVDENEDPDLRHVFLHNFHTRTEISSGQVIQLSSDDPSARPLPDPTLLSLHAAISQVVRMAGRAGIPEWEYDDSEYEQEPQHNSRATSHSTPATPPKGAPSPTLPPTTNAPPPAPTPNPTVTQTPQTTPPHLTPRDPSPKKPTSSLQRLWTAIKRKPRPK